CGHHSQRIQIEPNNIGQNSTAQFSFVIADIFTIFVIPATNTSDSHNEESTGATSRIEYAQVRISVILNLVKNIFCKPIWSVVFAEVVSNASRKQVVIQLFEKISALYWVFRKGPRIVGVQL